MISISNLTKTYKGNITALRGINLEIGQGMFGLLGPNGAGKTTLMRMIAGLLNATSGKIEIDGCDPSTRHGKQAIQAMLGYLPQELGMYPDLTARQFQVNELLELVRLADVADRKIKTFSGGMKRRVGIAQTMLGNPKLLIVDEPTVGLDPEERVRIRNILSDMALRCTVILSTHVIEDISHSCNDLAIINKGAVLYRGSPSDLIQQARGKVWSIMTQGDYPDSSLTVVSTLQLQNAIQYRVIGTPEAHYNATPLEPGLEDGYMLRMRQ